MGSGSWSTNVYDEHARYKAAAGKSAFDFSDSLHLSDRSAWHVHAGLDPHGVSARESRDSADHPQSNAIAVMFDVTGSMGEAPMTLQKKLPELLGLLMRKAYIPDPQILFGGIGDATCDAVPLQVGQFESDNRMDENLDNIFLEGGGGGQRTESYELAMYFIARHTQIDCWTKRGRKGYLFIIGDEMAYPQVNKSEVKKHIADGLESNLSIKQLVQELKKRYHVFYLLPKASSYGGDKDILRFWRALLGETVLELQESEAVCEVIALAIGMTEGTVDLAAGAADLKEWGVSKTIVKTVTSALAALPTGQVQARVSGGVLPGLSTPLLAGGAKRRI